MAILYTQAQVNNALVRAQVGIYLISENIEEGFIYFYPSLYANYKALQYDLYTLFDVINNEKSFVTYNPTPTTYEADFYNLVGSMINKTKQTDVFGQFGGAINPYYEAPNTVVNITVVGSKINTTTIAFTNQTTITLANYNTVYAPTYGKLPLVCQIYVDNGSDPSYPDFGTAPAIDFVTNDNPASGIASVTWTYSVPTTGYIYLSGIQGG